MFGWGNLDRPERAFQVLGSAFAWRGSLAGLRCAAVGVVTLILLGPTRIDPHSFELGRPEMIMLLDGSASMKLGGSTTRWQDGLQVVKSGLKTAVQSHSSQVSAYRFGH
jgi:hypothetical protein